MSAELIFNTCYSYMAINAEHSFSQMKRIKTDVLQKDTEHIMDRVCEQRGHLGENGNKNYN